jgi:hypothetical protein
MFRDWLLNEERNNFKKKLIDQYGKYRVYTVDGESVRNSSPAAEEFGGSAIHANISIVPENEIWIEDDIDENETKMMIASTLYELKALENGMSPGKAYEKRLEKEKDYRESQHLSKQNPLGTDKPAKKSVHIQLYGKIKSEDMEVWLVNGHKVRDLYKCDFIEGGQPAVYSWVPNNEIWIEKGPHLNTEAPLLILHEFVEFIIMKYNKMKYDEAHKIAAKIEFKHRSKSFSKEDALALTKEKVLKMV